MGTTSNEAKQRRNDSHYTQVKVSVQPEIAEAFKRKCQGKGISMASEISQFMGKTIKKPDSSSTRQQRRKALASLILGSVYFVAISLSGSIAPQGKCKVKTLFSKHSLILQLEEICDAEKQYWDNIPINMQNGERYEAAEHAYTAMEEALSLLYQAY